MEGHENNHSQGKGQYNSKNFIRTTKGLIVGERITDENGNVFLRVKDGRWFDDIPAETLIEALRKDK